MKKSLHLLIPATLLLLFNSCRHDIKEVVPVVSKQQTNANAVYIPVNKTVPGILTNTQGDEIKTGRTSAVLTTDPQYCTDPSSAVVGPHTIVGITHAITDCQNLTHTLSITWILRSSFDLFLSLPDMLPSRGTIAIKSGSTIIYQAFSVQFSSFTYLGEDPNAPGVKLYRVSYSRGFLHQYLAPGAFTSIEFSLWINTDCPNNLIFSASYEATDIPGLGINPCERVDPVYITPATSQTPPPTVNDCGSIAGSYVLGGPGACQNFTPNPASQVVVKRAGDPDASYTPIQTKAPGTNTYTTNGYVSYWEVRYIKQLQDYVPNATFPGNYTFRWRNVDGTCFGPWSAPVTLTINDF